MTASAPCMAQPLAERKLRLLCLHGYMQNAAVYNLSSASCLSLLQRHASQVASTTRCSTQVFRARVGSLRKALKSRADLVFVDGPHAVTAADGVLAAEAGAASTHQRAWWSWQVCSLILGLCHVSRATVCTAASESWTLKVSTMPWT